MKLFHALTLTCITLALIYACTDTNLPPPEAPNFRNSSEQMRREGRNLREMAVSLDSTDTACNVLVTAIRGIDGCGLMFQTEDSVWLDPIDPYDSLVEGNHYLIGYFTELQATACMMGETIRLTCIQEMDSTRSSRK